MKRYSLALAPLIIFIIPRCAIAQEPAAQEETVEVTKIKPNDIHGATYLKTGFVKWDNVTSEAQYHFKGLSVEIEKYFSKNHAQLSGFTIGYRKDVIYKIESGQMLNFKVFRTFGPEKLQLKLGSGFEWGSPSSEFDKTQFDYSQKDRIIYQHSYPVRNSNLLSVGTSKDAVTYPFIDFSLVTRIGPVLFEVGARNNFIRFGIENYDIRNNHIDYNFRNRTLNIPSLFINIGIKM